MKQFVKTETWKSVIFIFKNNFKGLVMLKLKNKSLSGLKFDSSWENEFEATLNELEAWKSFKSVWNSLLRRYKAPNYEIQVQNMIEAYKDLGCSMSLKVYFCIHICSYFPENASVVKDEHGER